MFLVALYTLLLIQNQECNFPILRQALILLDTAHTYIHTYTHTLPTNKNQSMLKGKSLLLY